MKSLRVAGVLVAAIVILSMLLSACAPQSAAPTTAPAQPTTAPATAAAEPTTAPEPTQPPATTAPEPTNAPEPTTAPATTAPEATQAPAAAAGGNPGGVLKQAYVAPTNLDPAFLSSVADDEIGRQWGDFLVYTGEEDAAGSEPQPGRKVDHQRRWPDVDVHAAPRRQVQQRRDADLEGCQDHVSIAYAMRRSARRRLPLYTNITDVATPDDITVVFTLKK